MTSMLTSLKQVPTNSGYYVLLASGATSTYVNTGTDDAPNMSALSAENFGSAGSVTAAQAANAILRDEGKTLRSAGRVFRKVQLMQSTNSVVNGGTDGVG